MESPRAIPDTPPLPYSYAPLPPADGLADDDDGDRGRLRAWGPVLAVVLMLVAASTALAGVRTTERRAVDAPVTRRSRGKDAGVSEKTARTGAGNDVFPWSNATLHWQRTAFHFQPLKNWMNDPNGPLYYLGWYHLFYQYNPDAAVWGNISWGHAVSRDLVRWRHLPLAMVPDRWYDINGVWTGSATLLPNGTLAMLYTGSTNASVQVQCLALPADPADPLLRRWAKHPASPVLLPPPGIDGQDFRDPTTAWRDPRDGAWRTAIGSQDGRNAGIALVYRTADFLSYELIPGLLHRVDGTGMWECVDLFPVHLGSGAMEMEEALNMKSSSVMYVLKASMDDDRHDYYALGKYDAAANAWTPMDEKMDVGMGHRYDYGNFYASKTFYDPAQKRRVLWGWVPEDDPEPADVAKGWASLQSIPRTVQLDPNTRANLLQWPVREVDTLRINSTDLGGIAIDHGSVFLLSHPRATQLDVEATFRIQTALLDVEAASDYNCTTSGGAAGRGALGPFGLLVLANGHEQTAVYFYVSKGTDGALRTSFCHDESRSSRAAGVIEGVVGSTVPVLEGELLHLRVLVDHSIVESFAQGGRAAITSRVYPTQAIDAAAGLYVFNNATAGTVAVEKLIVHQMDSSYNHDFMLLES